MRQAHPHNYSARVTDSERERLEAIKKVYGPGMNPSALASNLLSQAANCGSENIHVFLKEVASLASRLKVTG